jgi:hypothetical protein
MKDDDLISRMVQEAKRVKRNEDTIAKLLANFGTTRQEAESILEGLYRELNAAKFNHELPDDPLIKISNEMGGNPASFKILSDANGNVSIYVSPGCEPQDYRRTMLHEMCHYFASGHGDEFQKKRRRLLKESRGWKKSWRGVGAMPYTTASSGVGFGQCRTWRSSPRT